MINLSYLSSFFLILENFISSKPIVLIIAFLSLIIKLYLIVKLHSRTFKYKKTHQSLILLFIFIITAMIADSAWVVKLTREILLEKFNFKIIDYRYALFWIRLSWVFNVIQFHSLSLFIESLIKKKKLIDLKQKIYIPTTLLISSTFFIVAITQFNNITPPSQSTLLKIIFNTQVLYNIYALLLLSTIITIIRLKRAKLPRLLKKQLKIFLWLLITPFTVTELINFYPLNVFHSFMHNQFTLVSISLILTTLAIYYSIKKVICLKFLNIQETVKTKRNFNFIQDFKQILEQFSLVTSTKELNYITQNFFKSAYCIPIQKTKLYIRKQNNNTPLNQDHKSSKSFESFESFESIAEKFISTHTQCPIAQILNKSKIIIKDDIEFNNYYEEDEITKIIIDFLYNTNTAIFIPIYEKNNIIAYIVIEDHIRMLHSGKKSDLYSNEEKDQMIVFASYLGNIIHLLNNKNIKTLIRKEKELEEELYSKHQEINQYKESIRSLLNKNKDKKIGILFYRNRHFVFGNQIAKNLISININTHEGHPITKELKKIAFQALMYKSPQTSIINDPSGNKLVLYAIPNIEKDETIIAVHYPEISDILKTNINLLKDPTKWDYLLYLETTKSGKLINKLIPGNGETLLNFKIETLKIALSNKAILLDMPQQDLVPTVEILHLISLRENLQIINLQKPVTNFDLTIKLFGINPIFQAYKTNDSKLLSKPLLESLNNNGTLFIKNIHLLDIETQNKLAEFIRYGIYKPFKGEQTLSSNVRIICSTNINLKTAIQDDKFSKNLFNELNKASISMPPLMTLPEDEITNLTKGFTRQAIKLEEFKHVFELTDIEEKKIVNSKPASLQEIKKKVQKLLDKKSKNNEIFDFDSFYTCPSIKDPEIIEAARLGRHALKNKKIMIMLWNTFKNQNKIATLLGVNRSSVNRRCKEYDLL